MKIKPVWDAVIDGVECLESEDEIGYFKSENDRRPSSCTWIKKKGKTMTDLNLSKSELRDILRFHENFSICSEEADGKEMRTLIVISNGNKRLHESGYPFIKIIGEGVDGKFYNLGWHDHYLCYVPVNTDCYGKNVFHIMPWGGKTQWVVRGKTWTSTFEIGNGYGRDTNVVELR